MATYANSSSPFPTVLMSNKPTHHQQKAQLNTTAMFKNILEHKEISKQIDKTQRSDQTKTCALLAFNANSPNQFPTVHMSHKPTNAQQQAQLNTSSMFEEKLETYRTIETD
jgi:hypothetical protein